MNWILLIVLLFGVSNIFGQVSKYQPEINMNTAQVVQYYGYPFERHEVTTDDGYVLDLHRIPSGKNKTEGKRPVVILQHGLLDSSFTWVSNTPKKSLGFILADNGFDVWLTNSRGNIYSKNHIIHQVKSNSFWDFSFDELANFDLPATIQYILDYTESEKLSYIGHSQGTLIGFAKFGQASNLNSRISSFVALAPVAYLGNIKSPVKWFSYVDKGVHWIHKLTKSGEFLPDNLFQKLLAEYVCGHDLASYICSNILFVIAGYSTENLDRTRLPIYLSHCPAGTSSKNMVHFAQAYKSGQFKMYDYGIVRNLYHYKSTSPPKYSLNMHGIPTAMIWGGKDWLADDKDVTRAIKELGDDVKLKKFIPKYNHLDFIWGKDAKDIIYQDIIDFIRQYQ